MDQYADIMTGIYRAGEPRWTPPVVVFAVESVSAIRQECLPLIDRHYDEIAQFKQVQKLDPDWDAYARLEVAGKSWVMTARASGVLVGYIVMLISTGLHYRKLVQAAEDIHYILPEYRRGLTGYRMLALTKKAMQARGVHTISFRTKSGDKDHGLLFERLGGVLHDLVYTIVL